MENTYSRPFGRKMITQGPFLQDVGTYNTAIGCDPFGSIKIFVLACWVVWLICYRSLATRKQTFQFVPVRFYSQTRGDNNPNDCRYYCTARSRIDVSQNGFGN
jgi:hypothetical protein